MDNDVDKPHLTSQKPFIHAVCNKLPGFKAKIYANEINNLVPCAAGHQTIHEANSYKTRNRGITGNTEGKIF